MVRTSDTEKRKVENSPLGVSLDSLENEEEFKLDETQILEMMGDSQISKMGRRGASLPRWSVAWDLEVIKYYKRFLDQAIKIRTQVHSVGVINPTSILKDLYYIIKKDHFEKLYEYAMSAPEQQEEVLIHQSVGVMFTALMVGRGLGYNIKKLLKLGLAGFLQDVGMYKIPDSILKKKGKLARNELKVLKKHPWVSYEILLRMGDIYHWLADVALQVHERSDGSGYPKGLKVAEILEMASIIGLVDIYVAMIRDRPYRDKLVQTSAVKFIVEGAEGLFPRKIRKAFLDQITLFPVNTYVRLNNEYIGRVLYADKEQGLRPTIELIYDGRGRKLERREVIRLSENPLLYITGSIGERELP